MTTKNFVPRADGEGSIGTPAKNWLAGFFKDLTAKGLFSALSAGQAYDDMPGSGYGLHAQVETSGVVHIDSYSPGGSTAISLGTNSGGAPVREVVRLASDKRATFRGATVAEGVLSALGGLSVVTSFTSSVSLVPGADNAFSIGAPPWRWSTIFAGTGAINTSDERTKTAITPLTDAEKAAALEIRASIGSFQFLDAVDKKGDDARLHIGIGAQTVKGIMEKHGLDPARYGFFCFDEWDAETEERQIKKAVTKTETVTEIVQLDGVFVQHTVTREIQVDEPVFDEFPLYDEGGNQIGTHQVPVVETIVTREAGNRYGIRYEELAMFILGALS